MPLMLAMFIALEIHSFLSLAFQKEKVNIVSAMRVITKTNDYLVLFKKKKNNLQNFPVWNIYYQNVIKLTVKIPTKMVNSLTLKNLVSTFVLKKNEFLDDVKSSAKDRLSGEIKSNKIFESVVQILNTEGWERE